MASPSLTVDDAVFKRIRRNSLVSDRRSLTVTQRAELAVRVDGESYRSVQKALRVSAGSLHRARKAKNEGRQVGRRGRPPITSFDEDSEIIARVLEEADRRRPATYQKVIEIVSRSLTILEDSPDDTGSPGDRRALRGGSSEAGRG